MYKKRNKMLEFELEDSQSDEDSECLVKYDCYDIKPLSFSAGQAYYDSPERHYLKFSTNNQDRFSSHKLQKNIFSNKEDDDKGDYAVIHTSSYGKTQLKSTKYEIQPIQSKEKKMNVLEFDHYWESEAQNALEMNELKLLRSSMPVLAQQQQKKSKLMLYFYIISDEEDDDDVEDIIPRRKIKQKYFNATDSQDKIEYKLNSQSKYDKNDKTESDGKITYQHMFCDVYDLWKMIIPDNSTVVSFITRDKSGFKVLNPDYRLYLKDNTKHLISGKKKLASVGSDFMICTAPRSGWRPPEENIGTMSSNFPGSVYNIFKKPYGISYWKQELIATVKFTNNLTLEPAPRKFGVYLLKEGIKYFDLEGHKNDYVPLNYLYMKGTNAYKIMYLRNRKPIFSYVINGYVLNFSSRVKHSSIKNFILYDLSYKYVLMMGKQAEDIFRLDISAGITPFVGFCIALTVFDSKFI